MANESLSCMVRESINKISQFYATKGVSLGPVTFTLVDSYSPISKSVIAQVPGELVAVRALTEQLMKTRLLRELPVWYAQKGIAVSESALMEYIYETFRRTSNLTPEGIARLQAYGSDVLIFPSLAEIVKANSPERAQYIIDDNLSHELWHIVEERRGLIVSPIAEGTAEYARLVWGLAQTADESYSVPDSLEDKDPGRSVMMSLMGKLVYRKGLHIVKQHAQSLTDLIDPQKRTLMEKDYNTFLDQWVNDQLQNKIDPHIRGRISRFVWPEFLVLDTSLSKDSLLNALCSAGLPQLAEELSTQDCSGLLAEYNLIGYGPR